MNFNRNIIVLNDILSEPGCNVASVFLDLSTGQVLYDLPFADAAIYSHFNGYLLWDHTDDSQPNDSWFTKNWHSRYSSSYSSNTPLHNDDFKDCTDYISPSTEAFSPYCHTMSLEAYDNILRLNYSEVSRKSGAMNHRGSDYHVIYYMMAFTDRDAGARLEVETSKLDVVDMAKREDVLRVMNRIDSEHRYTTS